MMKTMVIEPVSAFNGMDVLVARDEGIIAAAGFDLRIVTRQPSDLRSAAKGMLERPVTNQGSPARTRRSPHVSGMSLRR
jgi:hypothetical protein